ncbi:MAG: hypothetical protein ABSA83_05230 [Verrucomicrobiota bacterium]|jgi:hypothetical protein
MNPAFRFASTPIAVAAAMLLILANTGCVHQGAQPATVRFLSEGDNNQLRNCRSILVTGIESYQLFKPAYYPWHLLPGGNAGKKLEFRDPYWLEQSEQPIVDDPDLTIDVSDYREEYGRGIEVGPGFTANAYVGASVRVTVRHPVLGVLYDGRFKARPPLGHVDSPKASSLATLARRIKASPVGKIILTALSYGG